MQLSLAPQLAFNGQCRDAFETYADVFGGRVVVMNTFGGNKEHSLPSGSAPAGDELIRFAEVRFGESVLRGNDVPADAFKPMQGFSLSVHIPGTDEARRVFARLSEGGSVTTPLENVDWADLFGMVVDRFGVSWIVLAVGERD